MKLIIRAKPYKTWYRLGRYDGTALCAMLVPLGPLQWYGFVRYDGTARPILSISQLTECQQTLFWQSYWQNPCNDPSLEEDLKLFESVHGYNHEKETMKEAYKLFSGKLPVMQ